MPDAPRSQDPDTWRHFWRRPSLTVPLITGVLGVLAGWLAGQAAGPATPPAAGPAPSASVTSTPSADLGCWAYVGDDPTPTSPWDPGDFENVPCVSPHQFESVQRGDDTQCDDAVYELLNLGEILSWGRVETADLGPYSCAVGRTNESDIQTDTYRITTAGSVVAAFGSCINTDGIDAYLAGSPGAYEAGLPCQSGRVLTINVSVGADATPEESCEVIADNFPHSQLRSAAYETSVGSTAARCAYTLAGVAE